MHIGRMNDFKTLLARYRASELAVIFGVETVTVYSMSRRNTLPARYFTTFIDFAKKHGDNDITHELLCEIAANNNKAQTS